MKKTVALALSGCSARAVAYIGILEIFEENGVPVDMIAACSSGALVACAYASGRLPEFKKMVFGLTSKRIFQLLEPSFKGGLFTLDSLDEVYRDFLTAENIEDLKTPIAIVASDLVEGKEVVFRMGNILRALKASCSMPGVFEPIVWGNKILVDGGLFNIGIVPIEAAREFDSDLIIGVDMTQIQKTLKKGGILDLKSAYNNYIRKPFVKLKTLPLAVRRYMFGHSDVLDYTIIDEIKTPSLMAVLGKALDYTIEERKKSEFFNCDLLITPEVHSYNKLGTTDFELIYQEGRKAAVAALPRIKELFQS